MHNRGKTLCLITILVCLMGETTSWSQQTYNPTESDPITFNTAGGTLALPRDSGDANTALGWSALRANTDGYSNTATGVATLRDNTTGNRNTATGSQALQQNTIGILNTATGEGALGLNTTGWGNTATGAGALSQPFSAQRNTAVGYATLRGTTLGVNNTATGAEALMRNTTGAYNVADGAWALISNTTGNNNTAVGTATLSHAPNGSANTALGYGVLAVLETGIRNTAVGWTAGDKLRNGNQNLYLASPGFHTENRTTRIGTPGIHTRAFIAGVAGVPIAGAPVTINSNGQLGILASSARYKQDIQPMGNQGQKLQQLRPVTFSYKEDITATRQYGLIAEEVAKIYPEFVTHDEAGTIESIQYHQLISVLLHEVQRQQQELAVLKAQNKRLQATLTAQQATIATRLERLEAAGVRTTRAQR